MHKLKEYDKICAENVLDLKMKNKRNWLQLLEKELKMHVKHAVFRL
jgi:hypothetical protein